MYLNFNVILNYLFFISKTLFTKGSVDGDCVSGNLYFLIKNKCFIKLMTFFSFFYDVGSCTFVSTILNECMRKLFNYLIEVTSNLAAFFALWFNLVSFKFYFKTKVYLKL